MELSQERDASAIGNLFQQIINDMKNAGPIWEDFVSKASKLHACLRATIQAISAYLDVFQKIADAATNSKGATKEIGTALTRICLRHKSVETRMKTFTSTIMDSLIIPLQNKLDDWQRQTSLIDKEYAKEHKRCRTELKKRSTDTLRLKKKAKRGQTDQIQSMIETSMLDISAKRDELDAVDRKSLREVMVEERHRYCAFVHMLQPVVKEECDIMYELGHLREAMDSIAICTKDPATLPELSENMILELRAPPSASVIYADPLLMGTSQTTRCSISTGSRKSSVGSINSLHSSDSRECPPAGQYQRSISQFISPVLPRLTPGESKDSGFSSTSILTTQTSTASSNASHAISTWPPHSVDAAAAAVAASAAAASGTNTVAGAVGTPDRPHTISSAYEKGHQRPALTVYTFQSPDAGHVEPLKMSANLLCRPPLPVRCSSLERPLSGTLPSPVPAAVAQQPPQQRPSAIPAHITKDTPVAQPTYVNTADLATLTAHKYAYPLNAVAGAAAAVLDQVNSPVMSIGSSSRASTDSLIATQHSSPDHSGADKYQLSYIDSPVSTGTNTNTTTTPTATGTNAPTVGAVGAVSTASSSLDVTAVDSTASSVASSSDIAGNGGGGHDSGAASADRRTPADDFKSIGSVLEKLSIFEKIKSFNGGPATGSSSFSTSPSSDSTSASLTLHKQLQQQQPQAVGTFKLDACALKQQQQQQQQHQHHHQQQHHRNEDAVPAETVGRTTRRSSFNNAKPPPPVRRSSSVTPSHQIGPIGHVSGVPHHQQQQQLNSSSESLPPPPQYLLSSSSGRTSPGKVCETIKALTEIRHMPASPGVIRRAQILQQQQQQQQLQLQQQQLLQQAHPVQTRTYLAANHQPVPHQHTDSSHINTTTAANVSSFGAPAASVASVAAPTGNHASSNVSSFKNSISDAAQRYSQKKSNSSVLAQLNARINKYTAENNAAIAAAASMPKGGGSPAPTAQPAQPQQSHLHSYAPAQHPQQQQHQEYAHIDPHQLQQQQQLYATQQQLHQQQLQQHQQQQQQQLYHHQQLQQQLQQQQQYHHAVDQHEVIYSRPTENTNPFHQPQATWNQRSSSGATFGHHRATSAEPAAPMRNERTGRCKAESAFLQNLNSRLAEQAMSGKAFAVRNLINSKALPDPRICHESLMDQIKRGATLTRNKSINDRSAPKIHKK